MKEAIPLPLWKFIRALAPAVAIWLALVALLGYLLIDRTDQAAESDEASIREWIDEGRPFRKTLPELIRELLERVEENGDVTSKKEELGIQLRAMVDPVRLYQGQLPVFPEFYRLEVRFLNQPDTLAPISWDSPVPRPKIQYRTHVRTLDHVIHGPDGKPGAVVHCEYRMHAFNKLQRDESMRQRAYLGVGIILVLVSSVAAFLGYRNLRKERTQREAETTRELEKREAETAREHAEVLMLEARIEKKEADARAAEAEHSNLEMRSQLYASIGIMAGSYAHNIKNLLVRPNDLINRCIESEQLRPDQTTMLNEVKSTLGTVTERLQMILRTVRRDPNKAEMTRLDVNDLIRETDHTWSVIGREKWKMTINCQPAPEPLVIRGDLSHLQQAIENLVFNARDATFEMRNQVRDSAREETNPALRKQALIDAASWRGEVRMTGRRDGDYAILEVQDNGIGMTENVRERCMQTHFSTKRDNALYEGYNAGMGLGLSFVAVVLEHHSAKLELESQPLQGALFRLRFALAESIGSGVTGVTIHSAHEGARSL